MSTVAHNIGGRRYQEVGIESPRVALLGIQDGKRALRQPASLRPLLDKLTSGASFPLTDDERGYVRGMQIELVDVTVDALQSEALALLATGMGRDVVNATLAAKAARPHFKTANPVTFTGAFAPIY